MKKIPYYPGCSIKGTGLAYEESLKATLKVLGGELDEIEDWNCCGATAYMATDKLRAIALAGRNLAMAEEKGAEDLMVPCNACYLVLNKTRKQMAEDPEVAEQVGEAMKKAGLSYKGKTNVKHPLEIFLNDFGLDLIKEKTVKPLKGMKIAPYYGCQIVRPYSFFDDQHDPTSMDRILKTLGAEVVDYPYKTRCCGGSQTGTLPEIGLDLVHMLLKEAQDRGADAISVVCPLCQFNLDGYQDMVQAKFGLKPMPILYLTQFMAMAFGCKEKEAALNRGIVPAKCLMRKEKAHV